jgi:hypothetical protein
MGQTATENRADCVCHVIEKQEPWFQDLDGRMESIETIISNIGGIDFTSDND